MFGEFERQEFGDCKTIDQTIKIINGIEGWEDCGYARSYKINWG